MKRILFAVLCPLLVWAQHPSTSDPQGSALYRSNCAFCHGLTGKGGRGPNLTGQLNHGASLDDIKRVIKNGVPGTQMPSFVSMEPDELDTLARFVQKFSQGANANTAVTGDPVKGQQVYASSGCANCHRIGDQGSVYGPELTRIGVSRSLDYLRESIVDPSKDIPEDYTGVTVVTKDGKKFTGVRINEDTFSIQLRTPDQKFRMFQKSDLQQVSPLNKQSLMPSYSRLAPQDLDNLLAYLSSLRGEVHPTALVDTRKGIK